LQKKIKYKKLNLNPFKTIIPIKKIKISILVSIKFNNYQPIKLCKFVYNQKKLKCYIDLLMEQLWVPLSLILIFNNWYMHLLGMSVLLLLLLHNHNKYNRKINMLMIVNLIKQIILMKILMIKLVIFSNKAIYILCTEMMPNSNTTMRTMKKLKETVILNN
jgi:hypothetical protein